MIEDNTHTEQATLEPSVVRDQMVVELIDAGEITDTRIEAAFRTVPREIFYPPATPVEQPYLIHDEARMRLAADGTTVSWLPAPILQARALAQLRVEPGMRVLQVGSSGPLAALLAHLVGPGGQVAAVDIDEPVTDRTRAGIEQLGLADRVKAVTQDAGLPLGRGVFDRIIVTAAVYAIPEIWLEQLAPNGVLVAPVEIAPNHQRVIAFRHDDGLLIAESVMAGHAAPIQGVDQYPEEEAVLTGPSGGWVSFQFDDDKIPDTFAVTAEVLDGAAVEAWTGVTYRNGAEQFDLFTWVLVQPGGCQIAAEDRTDFGPVATLFPAIVDGASFACLATRPVLGPDSVEIGAVAKGPKAGELAGRLVEIVRAYDSQHRGGVPAYRWLPGFVSMRDVPPHITMQPRPHGALMTTWPGGAREDEQTRLLREHTNELRDIDPLALSTSLVPLLGEQRPRGPLMPVTTEAHRAAAAQMGRQFRHEGGYDFNPYNFDDDDSQPLLILSNFYATFPIVAGAVGMTHDEGRWTLEWVWIHPLERGPRLHGRGGLFPEVWDALEAEYGAFYIQGPYSKPMRTFITRRGIDSSRHAIRTDS